MNNSGLLRGPGGSAVKVKYIRNGKPNTVTITRGSIASPSITAAYMMKDGIGYIKLE